MTYLTYLYGKKTRDVSKPMLQLEEQHLSSIAPFLSFCRIIFLQAQSAVW